jgi:hypothetical protein
MQTCPAFPAVPQTSPVGQPFPEAQDGRQNSPVDSWTQLLPEAQPVPCEQEAVHRPPGKSALSTQVRPFAQLGLQVAEPASEELPLHAVPSATSTARKHDGKIRTGARA